MHVKDKGQRLVGEFVKFLKRDNVIGLATGLIVGAAFSTVVNSVVNDIMLPLIPTRVDFSKMSFTLYR